MRRMIAVVALLGLVAVGCGGGGATDAGPVPGRPTSTGAPGELTTTVPAGALSTAPASTTEVGVWLVRGETLEQVTRAVPRVARIGAEAVKALLTGPTAAESRAGLSTAVPRATRFLDLAIDASGIAKVDLSRDFEAGGGSLGMTLRLAQVTCTVGQFPTVKGVRFALGGELVRVFSGEGIVLDKPVTCDDYRQVAGRPGGAAFFAGIWPFATKADLDAYATGPDRTYRDPVTTARHFAERYVGMDNPVDFAPRTVAVGMVEVPIGFRYGEGRTPVANPRPTFTVVVRQLGVQDASGPWTVVEAKASEIVVASPQGLDRVASPVRLTGEARAFEGNVAVAVREDGMVAGEALGRGVVTGGGDILRPFSGDIAFRSPTRAGGAILFTDVSAADGQGILRASVVRVRF